MAKKRKSKKKSKSSKKKSKSRSKKSRRSKKSKKSKKKISSKKLKIAQRGFLWSLVFLVVSYLLFSFSLSVFFEKLFGVLMIIFGFLGLAFLISLIVLWFARKS